MKRNLILIFGLLAILACPLASTAQQIPAALPNNQFLRGVDLTNSIARNMIGINRSNVVRIDPDAIGTTFGGAVTIDGALTQTGQGLFADGSVTAPSISFTSETDLGLYRIAVGTIGVTDAGAEIARFSTTGLQMTGAVIFTTDNSNDIGSSGANRPRTAYLGTALAVGTTPATTGTIRLATGGTIYFRDNADSANLNAISKTSGDVVTFGSADVNTDITGNTIVRVNDGARDVDFVIESDTNASHFVSDAAFLGIGGFSFGSAIVANPQAYFYVAPPANATGVTASQSYYHSYFTTQAAVTIPAGTAPIVATTRIDEPNITATGTVTDATSLYINAAPTEGTRNTSLWVDAGVVRFDAGLLVNTTALTGTAITSSGTVTFIGITSSSTGDYMCFNTTTSEVTQSTSCTLSSERYKQDIESMSDMGLSTILALRPVTFISRIHPDHGRQPGFIAEEAELVDRRLVHYENGRANSFRYLEYTAVLTRALQQQQVRITELESRLVQLEARQN